MNRTRKAPAFTLVEIMIVITIIGLLAAVAIPNYIKARGVSRRNACIANLKQIHSAINTWALESHKPTGEPVDTAEIFGNTNYLKGLPSCPARGLYSYYDVGDPVQVECSLGFIEGHTL